MVEIKDRFKDLTWEDIFQYGLGPLNFYAWFVMVYRLESTVVWYFIMFVVVSGSAVAVNPGYGNFLESFGVVVICVRAALTPFFGYFSQYLKS